MDINLYHFKAYRQIYNHSFFPLIAYVLFFYLVILLAGCGYAYTEQEAIQTIVGEASNQGYKGMICVGEVIRHNSSLRGFYGLHASHSAKEGAKTWAMAKLAWEKSKFTNYTHGANHFENINAFGDPYWVKRCKLTFIWKDHKFYKEIK